MFLSTCYRLLKRYVPVVILSAILGFLAYQFTTNSLKRMVETSLTEIAGQGAVTVENEIRNHFSVLETIAKVGDFRDAGVDEGSKAALLKDFLNGSQALFFGWINIKGRMFETNGNVSDVSDQAYFAGAIKGKEEVYRSSESSDLVFAVPVFGNDEIIGVLCAFYPGEILCKLIDNIKFGKSGYGFIIDRNGQVIAHPDRSLVEERFNPILESVNDPELNALAMLEKDMTAGKTAAGRYRFKGYDKYMGYTKIDGLPWYMGVTTLKDEVFGSAQNLIFMFLVGITLFALILIGANVYLGYLKNNVKLHRDILKTAAGAGNILAIAFTGEGTILNFNRNAEKQFKDKIRLKKNSNVFDMLAEKDREKLKKGIERCLAGSVENNFELVFKKGKWSGHVLCAIHKLDIKNRRDCIEILGVDITERARKELELKESHEELTAVYEELTASEEELKSQLDELIQQKIMLQELDARYNLVVDAANIGIWDWDVVQNKTYYSEKWYEIFGFNKDDELSVIDAWCEYILPGDREKLLNVFNDHIQNQTSYYESEFRYMKDGKMKWILAIGKGLWDSDGKLVRMAGSQMDITPLKENEEKVIKLAYLDPLTGLPNKTRLTECFNETLESDPSNIALVIMDLDDFKLINDSYGHSVGDMILTEIAGRLKSLVGTNMILSRLGGDEFAVMVRDYESESRISDFVESIMRLVDGVTDVNGYHINLSVSIGIASYPVDAGNFDELLKNADTAMYKAKERRNRHIFYTQEMNDAIVERLNLTNCLRSALGNNEFMVYYQPQYRVCDRKVVGFEALLRWNSPKLGMVSPVKFIPVAEESKLINPIGDYVLRTALSFLSRINGTGGNQYIMCINISMIQLMQRDFTDKTLALLKEFGIPSELIELEITESVLMQSMASVMHNIILLRKAGVKIALDDFGTGYSSLNYLTQLPINTLKIDKSFIDNIGHIKEKSLLISSIVDIGRKLGLSVVAEGVEMEEQLDYLTRRRCDRVQGFLFSKPLPENEIVAYLERNADMVDMRTALPS